MTISISAIPVRDADFSAYGTVHSMAAPGAPEGEAKLVRSSGLGWTDTYTAAPLLTTNGSLGFTLGEGVPVRHRQDGTPSRSRRRRCSARPDPIVLAVAAPTDAERPKRRGYPRLRHRAGHGRGHATRAPGTMPAVASTEADALLLDGDLRLRRLRLGRCRGRAGAVTAEGRRMAEAQTAFFIGDVALDDYYTAERWPGLADKAYIRENKSYVGGMIANAASVHAGPGRAHRIHLAAQRQPAVAPACATASTSRRRHARTCCTTPTLPNSHNLIFLVGGEHVVLIGEIGEPADGLPAQALEALRTPGYLYITTARDKRLRADGLPERSCWPICARMAGRLVFDLDVHGFPNRRSRLSARRRHRSS